MNFRLFDVKRKIPTLATIIFVVSLGGCIGGQRDLVSTAMGGHIGGSISGLNGILVLQNNNSDNLTIGANGNFTFASKVADGNIYSVTVFSQPKNQYCSVSNTTGWMGAVNISNIAISCLNLLGSSVQGKALNLIQSVSTFAGHSSLNADGTGALASFYSPQNSVADGNGNLFVADYANNTIRRIVIATGEVTTLAGHEGEAGATDSGDIAGTATTFNLPVGITTDGTSLYVTDSGNNKVRKITPAIGTLSNMTSANSLVSSLTGQTSNLVTAGSADSTSATLVSFNNPAGITIDSSLTYLYVADSGNNKIRKISIASGATTSLTGQTNNQVAAGPADSATSASVSFNNPTGITLDSSNTYLYVADSWNNKIRQVSISSGATVSITGTTSTKLSVGSSDGRGLAASFNNPYGITIDTTNTYLYVADTANHKIRIITPVSGTLANMTEANALVSSLSGMTNTSGFADGSATTATFNSPYGISADGTNLYVADEGNNEIRKIIISSGQVSTLAGAVSIDATGVTGKFDSPQFDTTDGANLYVTDCGTTSTIRKILIATGEVTTLAGSPLGETGSADGIGTAATFNCPAGITTDGVNLYVADSGNNTIRQIVISSGVVTTLAGQAGLSGSTDSPSPKFDNPKGITTDNTNLFVTDYNNDTIRQIVISTGVVTTIDGQPGISGSTDTDPGPATFNGPLGVTTDGINLFVADSGNSTIRQIVISSGAVTTLAGQATISGSTDAITGSAATFSSPSGITTDGFNLYVVDAGNSKIRQISTSSGTLTNISSANAVVSSVTGTTNSVMLTGYADGAGSAATFSFNLNSPYGDITTDGNSLYVIDTASGTVRMIR